MSNKQAAYDYVKTIIENRDSEALYSFMLKLTLRLEAELEHGNEEQLKRVERMQGAVSSTVDIFEAED